MRCGVNRITTENQERLDLARLDISAQFRHRFQVIHRMRFHWLGVVECCPHVAERRVDGMRQSMNFSGLLFACGDQRHTLVLLQIFSDGVEPLLRASRKGHRTAKTELRRKRSEERRVGKECRSRWSPYH